MRRFALLPLAALVMLVAACTDTPQITQPEIAASPLLSVSSALGGGTFAYVTNNVSNNVSVIDLATNTVVGSPIPVGSNPHGIAITPDGTTA